MFKILIPFGLRGGIWVYASLFLTLTWIHSFPPIVFLLACLLVTTFIPVWLDHYVILIKWKRWNIFMYLFSIFTRLIFVSVGRTNCVQLIMLPKGEWPKWWGIKLLGMYIKTGTLLWWFHHPGSSINCPSFSLQVQDLWWKWPQLLLPMPWDWRVQGHNGLPFHEERHWSVPRSQKFPGLW